MRSLIAVLASLALATAVHAQSLAEHAAAAGGATIGTAAGKPVSNAITKIFGGVSNDAAKAAKGPVTTQTKKVESVPAKTVETSKPAPAPLSFGGGSSSGSSGGSGASHSRASRAPAPHQAIATVTPATAWVVPEPAVVKEPTSEEVASVKIGTTEKELVAALGAPASRVTIPDDGHLRESCQYWAKGRQLGTIRLDNGQVVAVEVRN
jgi:hypothetical protein